jgi:serpin B
LLLPAGKKDAVSADCQRPVEVFSAAKMLAQIGRTDGLADLIGPVLLARTLGLDPGAQPRTDKLVALTLPRFKAGSMANLIGLFSQLDKHAAFDRRQADFRGISGLPAAQRPMAISPIAHRAFIDVMEEGTEAAAATAVVDIRHGRRAAPEQP